MPARTLFLLRHATPETFAVSDAARPLTPDGVEEARGVRSFLDEQGIAISAILCSPAVRTAQTAEHLRLDVPATLAPELYHASADTIVEMVATLDADARAILVVGHAPGIPALTHELARRCDAAHEEFAKIDRTFAPATCARLDFDGEWDQLLKGHVEARLAAVHVARSAAHA